MIIQSDMKKVLATLVHKAERYEERAKASTDNESLYGYLRGYQDATEIAVAILTSQQSVGNEEYKELCDRIKAFVAFKYAHDSNINSDYLENFKKGREDGGEGAVDALSLVNGDWTKKETEDT